MHVLAWIVVGTMIVNLLPGMRTYRFRPQIDFSAPGIYVAYVQFFVVVALLWEILS